MAINPIQPSFPRGSGVVDSPVPPRTGPPGAGRRDAPVTEVDRVQLTSGTLRLREQMETPEKGPPIDEARIEALRKAINSGEYPVSSERLATNIMKFEARLP